MGKRGWGHLPAERRAEIAARITENRVKKLRETFADRFWGRIDKSGGPDSCWPWTGPQNGNGYGVVRRDSKNRYTHRLAWELRNGQEIPPGMHACHKCDNRICCNPDHIFIGTAADNIHDCMAKGRQMSTKARSELHKRIAARGDNHGLRKHPERAARGSRAGMAKLDEQQVSEIFARRARGELHKDIAAVFGVTACQIGRILRGTSWSHFRAEAKS